MSTERKQQEILDKLTLGSGQYGRVGENALPTRDSGAGFPQPQIGSDDGH